MAWRKPVRPTVSHRANGANGARESDGPYASACEFDGREKVLIPGVSVCILCDPLSQKDDMHEISR